MEENRRFSAMVSNLTGCAVGISDFYWVAEFAAESEDAAVEAAVKLAMAVNDESGLPPHGIVLTEDEIRDNLIITPA